MRKVAVVTGGTSGLGYSTVLRLNDLGYKVYSLSKSQNRARSLQKEHPTIKFIVCDISNPNELDRVVCEEFSFEENIDVLINNAGIIKSGGIETLSIDDWKKSSEINLDSVYYVTKILLPFLVNSGKASIINISSISSKKPGASIAYSVNKAGVDMLTKILAKELSKYGIRVNSVNPGMLDTGFQVHNNLVTQEMYNTFLENVAKDYPLGIGNTDDVVNLIEFLISDKASWITGGNYTIDGGASI